MLDAVGTENSAALAKLIQGMVVAIPGLLSTLAEFDRIMVLVDGKIAEDGPSSILKEEGGVFKDVGRLQIQSLNS